MLINQRVITAWLYVTHLDDKPSTLHAQAEQTITTPDIKIAMTHSPPNLNPLLWIQ
jgi:hypothetical protein